MGKKKYTWEFKLEAIKLVTEQGYSQSEAGKNLGMTAMNISRWIKEANPRTVKSTKKITLTAEQSELERLRLENKRLKLERSPFAVNNKLNSTDYLISNRR